MNCKAQVGTTITWVVATLIIVVVLGISVLATFSVSNKKIIFLDDKGKDLIATKSITGFLRNSDNVELLENLGDNSNKNKIRKFLEELSVNPPKDISEGRLPSSTIGSKYGGWNFEIDDGDEKIEIITSAVFVKSGDLPFSSRSKPFFESIFISGQKKLRFWAECQGGLCR